MTDYESVLVRKENHFSTTFETLNVFRQTGELCDVIIRAGCQEIPAHRVVLAACSPYFRVMFTTDFMEAHQPVVELKDVSGDALKDLIDYFYEGELVLNACNVEGLVQLSTALHLEDLLSKCETYMRRNISFNNCLGLQSFARTFGLASLCDQAVRFISWYFMDVHNEEEFFLLPPEQLRVVVASDDLRAPSEEYVFEAVLKWLLYDYPNRKSYFVDILPEVRFPQMERTYLLESNSIKFLVDNYSIAQNYIKEALELAPDKANLTTSLGMSRFRSRTASEDIYVIGGWTNGQKTSLVQCFNVDTLKWSTLTNMSVAHVAREDYFRVVVANEELYTISMDKVLKYDTVDLDWCRVADGPEIQCKWAGVCELDGFVYVIGGNSSKQSKRFNTQALEWHDLPPMMHSRYYPGVGVMGGIVYVIGGLNNDWMPLKTCERYDPVKNEWRSISRMGTPRWSLGVAVVDNQLFAIGGSHNVEHFANSVEVYNSESDTWEKSIAALNNGRRCLGVAVVKGSIYVVGGRVANTIECYDKQVNKWKVVGSVKTCCNFGCVALRII